VKTKEPTRKGNESLENRVGWEWRRPRKESRSKPRAAKHSKGRREGEGGDQGWRKEKVYRSRNGGGGELRREKQCPRGKGVGVHQRILNLRNGNTPPPRRSEAGNETIYTASILRRGAWTSYCTLSAFYNQASAPVLIWSVDIPQGNDHQGEKPISLTSSGVTYPEEYRRKCEEGRGKEASKSEG